MGATLGAALREHNLRTAKWNRIMDYRRLGKSGLKVSEFSFGSWVTFAKQVDARKAAFDRGL
jgi:hypothetical protein